MNGPWMTTAMMAMWGTTDDDIVGNGQHGPYWTTTVTRPLQDKWPTDNNDNDDNVGMLEHIVYDRMLYSSQHGTRLIFIYDRMLYYVQVSIRECG